MGSGAVMLHKDGYTDLRKRFDYASLSTDDLDGVERFAILVLSEEHGATVAEAAPPARQSGAAAHVRTLRAPRSPRPDAVLCT